MGSRYGLALTVLMIGAIHVVVGEWDYIVVGAGASGCIVAPELAKSGKSVLLLEAGGKTSWAFGGRNVDASFGTLQSLTRFDVPGENEKIRSDRSYWWDNVPWGLNGRGIGGSGVMNGALTFIPSPDDFRSWPAGWQYEQLKSSFDATMAKMSLTEIPSSDGKLYVQGSAAYFEQMATKRLGLREVGDLNSNPYNRVDTFSKTIVSAQNGRRMDACQAFLQPVLGVQKNLELRDNAEVRNIILGADGEATGVVLTDGSKILLNSDGKLVLAAGTFQTAKLLMVSGIGPESELERLSYNGLVHADQQLWVVNEEVGKGIHDHTFSQMSFRVPGAESFSFRYYLKQNDQNAANMYLTGQRGPYAQYGPTRVGFIGREGSTSPEVELLVMSSGVEGTGMNNRDCNQCFRILLMNMVPQARGSVKIKTDDMDCDCGGSECKKGDICKPNLYMSNEQDKQTMQWAMEKVIQAAQQEGYTVQTPPLTDTNGIRSFLDNSSEARYSASHWGGSCKIGTCTDATLKVKGTGNVFVVDSSLFSNPVKAHNVATVLAVAHRAAQLLETVQ